MKISELPKELRPLAKGLQNMMHEAVQPISEKSEELVMGRLVDSIYAGYLVGKAHGIIGES